MILYSFIFSRQSFLVSFLKIFGNTKFVNHSISFLWVSGKKKESKSNPRFILVPYIRLVTEHYRKEEKHAIIIALSDAQMFPPPIPFCTKRQQSVIFLCFSYESSLWRHVALFHWSVLDVFLRLEWVRNHHLFKQFNWLEITAS